MVSALTARVAADHRAGNLHFRLESVPFTVEIHQSIVHQGSGIRGEVENRLIFWQLPAGDAAQAPINAPEKQSVATLRPSGFGALGNSSEHGEFPGYVIHRGRIVFAISTGHKCKIARSRMSGLKVREQAGE